MKPQQKPASESVRAPFVRPRTDAAGASAAGPSAREAAVGARELDLAAREAAAATTTAHLEAREREARASAALLLAQMREANEQLVLTTLRAEALADDAGRAQAAAEVARDMLAATEVALREASRRKDDFLAMLGHELRNPLAPILTALELMKLRGDPASRERDVIERQVGHMVGLVDDLLDVSRITSGKIELSRAPLEIAETVAQAIDTVRTLLESRRHTLCVSVPATALTVNGDRNRLRQVVTNLLTNAAKYTDPGGTISVTVSREDGWVRLSVKDDGTGIHPDLLPRVFDQFVQGSRTIERADGGLGLGLAIVKSLVELHGGDVSAHSAGRGAGSEFIVRLPVLERASAPVARSGRAADTATPPARSARRILLVDDNVDAVEMLAAALGSTDRDILVVHDGPAALNAIASFAPDAMVIDIGLPIMDGYELAEKIRARERPGGSRLRLIALTGYGQDSDRQRSAIAGLDVHLVKPVNLASLEAALAVPPAASKDSPS